MTTLKSRACMTLVSLLAVASAACSNPADTGQVDLIAAPIFASDVATDAPQTATVCKAGSSPLGTYNYTAVNSGTTNAGDVLVPAFSLTIVAGGADACAVVFTRTQTSGITDPPAVITVTQAAAAGSILSAITAVSSVIPPVTDVAARTAKVGVNAFHSASVIFTSVAQPVVRGCTYTQGWYKNHTEQWPAGFSPSAIFYSSGKSWIDLYNTPPKGSKYIILAHQYMTAKMNIASGASVPAAVQSAYDAATAYFAAGGVGDIDGLSTVLDAYNNGVAAGGPAHCD